MYDHRRKHSTGPSISLEKSINNTFLWLRESMYNVYAEIGIWNLYLNKLESESTSGLKRSTFMELIFELTQTGSEMLSYV